MKILITRTAPIPIFEKALSFLRARYPEAEIDVLIQQSAIPLLKDYKALLSNYIVVKDGDFRISRNRTVLSEIRGKGYDLIVLLYANKEGMGYTQIDLLSIMSGISREAVYDSGGDFYFVESRYGKIFKKLLCLCAANILYRVVSYFAGKTRHIKKAQRHKGTKPALECCNRGAQTKEIKSSYCGSAGLQGKKRIVFIDLMFTWPPHGGACVDIKEVASGLKERGFDIIFIVPDFKTIFPRGTVDEERLPFKVCKIPFSLWSFNPFTICKRISDTVLSLNPDYIYLGDSYFLKPYLIERLKRYKLIVRFYTYELLCPKWYLLYKDNKACTTNYIENPHGCLSCALGSMKERILSMNWDVWIHEFIISLAFLPSYHKRVVNSLSLCHKIITYNTLCADMLSFYTRKNNIYVIPGGVRTKDFTPSTPLNDKVKKILVSGRLNDNRKGLSFFLDTVRRLREERDDFEVYITSSMKFTDDFIKPLGWVDHERLKEIYKEISFSVVPSLWEEPFGIVAVEAMASGKPVIASDVAGLRMSVIDGVTGLLFPPGDSLKLTECIKRLLDDPALVKKMGDAGRERAVKCFDWERIIDRYCEEVFLEV